MDNIDNRNKRAGNHYSNGLRNQTDDLQNISKTIIEYLKKICPATKKDIVELDQKITQLNNKLSRLEEAMTKLTNGVNNAIDPSDGILGRILAILNEEGRKETEMKEEEMGAIDVYLRNIIDILKKIWADFNSYGDILILVVGYFERFLKHEDHLEKDKLIDTAKGKGVDVSMILQDIEQVKNTRDALEQITGKNMSDFIISPKKGEIYDKSVHEETPVSYIMSEGLPDEEKIIDQVVMFGINFNENLTKKKAIVICTKKS